MKNSEHCIKDEALVSMFKAEGVVEVRGYNMRLCSKNAKPHRKVGVDLAEHARSADRRELN